MGTLPARGKDDVGRKYKPEVLERSVYRIIDANLNRAREGLRVCEEVVRFLMDDAELTRELKNIRHRVTASISQSKVVDFRRLVMERESEQDVGKKSLKREFERRNCVGIFEANVQRVKESMRVLEEFFKVIDKGVSEKFKRLRFRVYTLEKKAFERFSIVHSNR